MTTITKTLDKNLAKSEHFDPADQESRPELVNEVATTQDMYKKDTSTQDEDAPESSVAALDSARDYPNYVFETYRIDDNGNLAPRADKVAAAVEYFKAYGGSKYEPTISTHNRTDAQVAELKKAELEAYDKQVTEIANSFCQFNASSHVSPNGIAQRPSVSVLYGLASNANRLWAEWCMNFASYDDITSKDQNTLSPKQLQYQNDLVEMMLQLGKHARMLRDVCTLINDTEGSDFTVTTDKVQKAIVYAFNRKAEYETSRHKPVNVQAQANAAHVDLDNSTRKMF